MKKDQRISTTLKGILEVKPQEDRPSMAFARWWISQGRNGEESGAFGFATILDSYFDQGYTPTLADIEAWAVEQRVGHVGKFANFVDELDSIVSDEESPQMVALRSATRKLLDVTINENDLAVEISEQWAWLDDVPFWGGTTVVPYWHSARMDSALKKLHIAASELIDVPYCILQELVSQQISQAEQLQNGGAGYPSLTEFKTLIDRLSTRIGAAVIAKDEIIANAIRLGFLYRGYWWINNHGEITIRGYIAKQTSEKAGKGGGAEIVSCAH